MSCRHFIANTSLAQHTKRTCLLACLTLVALTPTFFGTAHAETVAIPLGNQAPELQDISRPNKGLTTEQVLKSYGQPLKQTPAVGTPPISRWTFDDFVVYFESNKVIHTVLKHREPKSTTEGAQAPADNTPAPAPSP